MYDDYDKTLLLKETKCRQINEKSSQTLDLDPNSIRAWTISCGVSFFFQLPADCKLSFEMRLRG